MIARTSGRGTGPIFRETGRDFARLLRGQRVAIDTTGRPLAIAMIGQEVAMPVALAPGGADRDAARRWRDQGGERGENEYFCQEETRDARVLGLFKRGGVVYQRGFTRGDSLGGTLP